MTSGVTDRGGTFALWCLFGAVYSIYACTWVGLVFTPQPHAELFYNFYDRIFSWIGRFSNLVRDTLCSDQTSCILMKYLCVITALYSSGPYLVLTRHPLSFIISHWSVHIWITRNICVWPGSTTGIKCIDQIHLGFLHSWARAQHYIAHFHWRNARNAETVAVELLCADLYTC